MKIFLLLLFSIPIMSLISTNKCSLSELFLKKTKIFLLLAVFIVNSFNTFAQTTSLISDCGDFIPGPNASWPHVLVATIIADGPASQASQTFTMNVTSLPADGANFRVYKTVANGNDYFGNPIELNLGSNSITVSAVTFDRAVKFQFSSGDVEFDALSLNGEDSDCVDALPPPPLSLISDCGDFVSGPSDSWPHVLVATTIAEGPASQASQTFTMNVTSLPADGANFRVYKTTANGNDYFGNPIALTLGSNSITVSAVDFDRAVRFQFSSGDVEFNALSLNGKDSDCIVTTDNLGEYVFDKKYGIKLFPNPIRNYFTISLEGIDFVDISILDIKGKLLLHKSHLFNQERIDISNYSPGIYFVKIITSDGTRDIKILKY